MLGFKKNDSSESDYKKNFAMVPSEKMLVQGLLLDEASGRQLQKTFDLRNCQPISNTGEDTLCRKQRRKLEK